LEREGCVSYFTAFERSRLFISEQELSHYLAENLSPVSYSLEVAACSRSLDISMADLSGWIELTSIFPPSEWFYALYLNLVLEMTCELPRMAGALEEAITLALESGQRPPARASVIRSEPRVALGLILVFAIVWAPVLVRWMFG
jgi:hypothetical protein